tara:strand:- start:168 stop:680 length:513 start_codon:yes stop_codon:yes gene_type:complete
MALTVETGSGLAAADTYVTLTAADTYFAARDAPAAWTALSNALKESALKYATEWLDGHYEWVGVIKTLTPAQALGWPRTNAFDHETREIEVDAVPVRIERACCEVALAHADSALNATQARGGAVASEGVGPLKIAYFDWASVEPTMPHITRLLRGYGRSVSSGVVDIVRG